MAMEATKLQSDTTVCLTLKQSTTISAFGEDMNCSGRSQDFSLLFCLGAKANFPCLSVKGVGVENFSLKS